MDKKKYKALTPDQRKVLEHKMKLEEMQKLKYESELNTVMFDLENKLSSKNLEFQKGNYEASIKIAAKNISEIKKLIKQGFEVKEQQTSDAVSDQFDAKESLKQKQLPPEVAPPEVKIKSLKQLK